MKNKFRSALFLVLVASLLTVLPGLAAPPLDLQIVVTETVGDQPPQPFTASGPAVDSGFICADGSVDEGAISYHTSPSSPYTTILVEKNFVCDDGSGSFDIQMNVRLEKATGETTARWHISGGTGDYNGLRGNGSLVGIPIVLGESILDIYSGSVY